jgi:hypothetical protein
MRLQSVNLIFERCFLLGECLHMRRLNRLLNVQSTKQGQGPAEFAVGTAHLAIKGSVFGVARSTAQRRSQSPKAHSKSHGWEFTTVVRWLQAGIGSKSHLNCSNKWREAFNPLLQPSEPAV